MKKIIKKWGNSLVVRLSAEELAIIGLSEGDVIEFTITSVEKRKKKGDKK